MYRESLECRKYRVLCIIAILLVICSPLMGIAQTNREERRSIPPGETKSIWEMSDDDLEKKEWDWKSNTESETSVGAALLAVGPGTVVHGLGHFYMDDKYVGWSLVLTEFIGAVLLTGGWLAMYLSENNNTLYSIGMPLSLVGGSIFIGSWVMDLVGSINGQVSRMSPISRRLKGIGPEIYYSLLNDPSLDITQMGALAVNLDFETIYFHPKAVLDFGGDYVDVSMDFGARYMFTRGTHDFIALEGYVGRRDFSNYNFRVDTLTLSLMLSLDIGNIFNHLSGLLFHIKIGYGWQLFSWSAHDPKFFSYEDPVSLLPFESGISFNFAQDLNFLIAYLVRPDKLIGSMDSQLGIISLQFMYTKDQTFDAILRLDLGSGADIWFGIRFWLW